ncbi:conjugal transfer protein [Bacillus safensis]
MIYLKKLKSYTRIWSVEKVIYAINDFRLPFPVTFNQMTWFVLSLLVVMLLGNVPPLSLIDGTLLKYVGIPVALTWFMSKKSFDGKKPYGFLKSVLTYWVRSKITYAGKPVKLQKQTFEEQITTVRSGKYGLSD